jgi:hypothetical protein
LLFATQSQLGAFVKLVSVSLSRNVHHHQVFITILFFVCLPFF